jgi:hypothetical protein
MFENINIYLNLVGKSGGKKPLGRCRHRLEASLKADLKEMTREGVY